MQQTEFYDWLYQTYGEDTNLLKTYAAKKCRIVVTRTDIFMCIDAITQYIYQTYIYQYENHSETDYSDLPELVYPVEENELEEDLVRILQNMRNPVEENTQTFTNDMASALQNDFINSMLHINMLYLDNMNRNMNIRRINEPKKFAIESVIEPEPELQQISECCICFENYTKQDFVTLNCSHEFCNGCLKKALCSDNRPKPCCAYCRTEVTKMISRTTNVYNELAQLVL